jgi:hypothetical protein
MQQSFAGEVTDILSATPEKTKILDAFDRAPDVGIRLALTCSSVACVAGLHELSLAERDIAQR